MGIEMDYFPGQMDEIWEAAEPYSFDYVYGSVHYLDGWDFGDSRDLSRYKGVDRDRMYRQYFELFCRAVEEGGFDVMAHPDLVKKHGVTTDIPLRPMYEAAADALARADVAIEVNSSGLRQQTVELYPALDFLSVCASRGVAVTLGSDAHSPGQVGMDFDLSLKHLRRAGVSEIASFAGRKRTMLPLPR
jgi:histidinol-phosphatase (PHP family)